MHEIEPVCKKRIISRKENIKQKHEVPEDEMNQKMPEHPVQPKHPFFHCEHPPCIR
jgi:hypothetical protein